MKKWLALLLTAATLLCLAAPAALAASPPVITQNPASVCWNEYAYVLYTCQAKGSSLKYKWYLDDGKKTYEVGKDHGDWEDAAVGGYGITMDGTTLYFMGTEKELAGCFVWCEVSNSAGSVKSTVATVLIDDEPSMPPAPTITGPAFLTVTQGDKLILTCNVSTGNVGQSSGPWLEYKWVKLNADMLVGGSSTVKKSNGITSKTSFSCQPDTSEPGTYYYVCEVWDGQDGTYRNHSYGPIVQVIVEEKEEVVDLEITRKPDKKTYEIGESPDLKGLKVRVWTSNGFYDTSDTSLFTLSPSQFMADGNQVVTISLEGASTTFTVTVNPGEVPFMITEQPKSVTVDEGEKAVFRCGCNVKADYVWGMIAPDGTTYYQINEEKFPVSGSKTSQLTVDGDPALDGAVFFCSIYPDGTSVEYTGQAILHVNAKEAPPVDPDPVDPVKPGGNGFDLKEILPWILCGVLGLLALVLLILLLVRRKKENQPRDDQYYTDIR